MRKEKHAETAQAYLMAEDKRIYSDLLKITVTLKESFCGRWLSRSHCNALDRAAKSAYQKAENGAYLFWGYYEVWAVREIKREGTEDRIGSFDTWQIYHGRRFGSG